MALRFIESVECRDAAIRKEAAASDERAEVSAIAHLAGTRVRMFIKSYCEPHSPEKAKAAALLRLADRVRPVQAA